MLLLLYCRFYRRAIGAIPEVINTLMIEGVRSYHAGVYQCFAVPDSIPAGCPAMISSANATLTIIGELKIPVTLYS